MTKTQQEFCNLVRMSFGTQFEDADPRRVHGLARMGRASGLTSEQLCTVLSEAGASEVEARVAVDVAFRIPMAELQARITAAIEETALRGAGGDGRNVRGGVDDADRATFAMIRVIGED